MPSNATTATFRGVEAWAGEARMGAAVHGTVRSSGEDEEGGLDSLVMVGSKEGDGGPTGAA